MAVYIATFYAHFGAVRFKRLCDGWHWPARMMPVPRRLSSSCGTCVRWEGEWPTPDPVPEGEMEQVVLVDGDTYQPVWVAEEC